jgi:hypothetical protein
MSGQCLYGRVLAGSRKAGTGVTGARRMQYLYKRCGQEGLGNYDATLPMVRARQGGIFLPASQEIFVYARRRHRHPGLGHA